MVRQDQTRNLEISDAQLRIRGSIINAARLAAVSYHGGVSRVCTVTVITYSSPPKRVWLTKLFVGVFFQLTHYPELTVNQYFLS
jgi:hypothetical protein